MRIRVAVAVLFLVGCTSNGGSGTTSSSGGASSSSMADAGSADAGPRASQYCETTAAGFCAFYLRCGRMAVPDEATCRQVFTQTCMARFQDRYEQLETAGLLSLSAAGVAACMDHLGRVSCENQVGDLDGPCGSMWVGTQAVGAVCSIDVESFVCAPGNACVVSLDLCGACRPVVEDGATCGDGVVTCGTQATCVDGTCVARQASGGACGASTSCALGARCVDGVCTPPTYAHVGEPCGGAVRCPYKSACVSGMCVESALLGGACGGSVGCASGRCENSVCQPLLEVGAGCSSSSTCRSGLCLEGACAALPGPCFETAP